MPKKIIAKEIAEEVKQSADEYGQGGDQDFVVFRRSQSSVVIKDDGKGRKSYEVKVYADTIQKAAKLAVRAALSLDKQILGESPTSEEG